VSLVDEVMVVPAQQDPEPDGRRADLAPPPDAVVDLAVTRRRVAPRVLAVNVARDDRSGLGGGEEPLLAPDVEDFALGSEDHAMDLARTGDPSQFRRRQRGAVL